MQKPESPKQPWQYIINATVISVLAQAGCLTFIIASGAILLGLWLDHILGTRPILTVLFLVCSVPVATFLVYKRVKSATAHLVDKPEGKEGNVEA